MSCQRQGKSASYCSNIVLLRFLSYVGKRSMLQHVSMRNQTAMCNYVVQLCGKEGGMITRADKRPDIRRCSYSDVYMLISTGLPLSSSFSTGGPRDKMEP